MTKKTTINTLYDFATNAGHQPSWISDDSFKVKMSTEDVKYEIRIAVSNNMITYLTSVFPSINKFGLSTRQYTELLENMLKISLDTNIRLALFEGEESDKRVFIMREFLISESHDMEDFIESYVFTLTSFGNFFKEYYEPLMLDLHKVS